MRIYILGFMGSGKSSFGRQLAAYTGFLSLDSDNLFEKTYQVSILDFFKKYTEQEFREKEQVLLHQTNQYDNVVISLGGGTPCFYDNMDWLLKNGICIYLKLSPKALQNRLLHSKKKRPLLMDKTPEELLGFIEKLLKERELFYQHAHITISGMDLNRAYIQKTFQTIIETHINSKKT